MLIVDVNALAAVRLQNFRDQVFVELMDAADAQDVLGIQGAGHQLGTLFHPLAVLDE